MVQWKFCGECRSLVVRPWYDRSFGFAESDDEMKGQSPTAASDSFLSCLFGDVKRKIRKRGVPLAKKKKTEILDF